MRCPNCGAECSDQAVECDFCGHEFVERTETQTATPITPPERISNPNRAVFTASEPTYTAPEPSYRPPPTPPPVSSENPYAASYPSSSKPSSIAAGTVPNNLIWAILATLCCCLPAGIVAIVYAAQVDGKLAAGDYHGAQTASDNAKMWSWISFGASVAVGVLYALLIMMGGIAESGRY